MQHLFIYPGYSPELTSNGWFDHESQSISHFGASLYGSYFKTFPVFRTTLDVNESRIIFFELRNGPAIFKFKINRNSQICTSYCIDCIHQGSDYHISRNGINILYWCDSYHCRMICSRILWQKQEIFWTYIAQQWVFWNCHIGIWHLRIELSGYYYRCKSLISDSETGQGIVQKCYHISHNNIHQ